MKLFLVLLLTIAFAPAAFGCRDPLLESQTFFDELPKVLSSKDVVAKIKVISSKITQNHEKMTTVKTVASVRGSKAGVLIKVLSDTNSCNRDPEIHLGREYYIAGAIGPDQIFRGSWKRSELSGPK